MHNVKRPPMSLEVIEIANPCPASWERMRGDEHVRFCTECNLHVYNLSAMPRDAAERLLAERGETGGRLCVRLYKRADGTVITRDCGGGLRAAARRAFRFASAAAGVVLCAAMAPFVFGASRADPDPATIVSVSWRPLTMLRAWFAGPPPVPLVGALQVLPPTQGMIAQPALMGDVSVPATQPSTQPTTRPTTAPSRPTPHMGRVAAPTTRDDC